MGQRKRLDWLGGIWPTLELAKSEKKKSLRRSATIGTGTTTPYTWTGRRVYLKCTQATGIQMCASAAAKRCPRVLQYPEVAACFECTAVLCLHVCGRCVGKKTQIAGGSHHIALSIGPATADCFPRLLGADHRPLYGVCSWTLNKGIGMSHGQDCLLLPTYGILLISAYGILLTPYCLRSNTCTPHRLPRCV